MTSLDAWLKQLEAVQPKTFKLGLTQIARVINELELTPCAPVISVAGTNGKGSTCAFLEAIFTSAGFRPLSFFSPHILSVNERIKVASQQVEEKDFVRQLELIKQVDAKRSKGSDPLSYFEYLVVAAVLLGNEQKCDVFVLEVGLGGRLDAVNAFDADVSVITSIGIDHVDHLGDTRELIGIEKAGIMRQSKPVIIGDRNIPTTVIEQAQKLQAPVSQLGEDFQFKIEQSGWTYRGKRVRSALPKPLMHGLHQFANASCALAVLEQLEDVLPVNQSQIRDGLLSAKLRGRFEIIHEDIPIVLDVAHNEAAAKVLSDALLDMGYYRQTHIVLGVRERKDATAILDGLAKRADAWHIVPLGKEEKDKKDLTS